VSVTNGKPANGNGLITSTAPPPMEGGKATGMAGRSENTTVEQLLLVLRRRWQLIVICVVLVTGAAIGFSLLQQDKYTASASLLFQNTQFDQELFGSNFTAAAVDPTREAATNIDLVSLPTVASRTAAVLHLPTPLVRTEVSVSGGGQADVAQVSATDPSPIRAAQIANTYVAQYVLFRQQADRSKIAGAQDLVQQELIALPPSQRYGSVGQSLQNRADQLGVLAALQTGNAEVVQPASPPTSPSSPRTKRNAILGALLGLLSGLGFVFLAERLDRRVRDASELEDTFGVPVLGAVPESPSYSMAGTEPLPALEAESFALLRARLRYFNVDREIQSLLVTSATAGEGKTTVALNLAVAEAVARKTTVVLVEADLRRPALAPRLGIDSAPGLAEILSRNSSVEGALRTVEVPVRRTGNGTAHAASFTVIAAGAIPPNPAELVESRAMIDLLSTLSEKFDLVIIDTPPTSVVSDAIPLMRLVSGAVIVSRIGVTTRDAGRHLREQLRKLNAPTLGVIANAMPVKSRGYYGYEYGYYADTYESRKAGDELVGVSENPTGVETA
jgi:capsular exopolysaccharide synthesis family protein